MLLTPEQLLREPRSERPGPHYESPRSLSNTALLASLMPPAGYGNGSVRPLRRSLEPQLVEGLSWFMDRAPWQRALFSTGLGALIGLGILITVGRLFLPELPAHSAAPATAASGLAALAAPPEALPDPPAPLMPPAPSAAPRAAAAAAPSEAAPALDVPSLERAPDVKPAKARAAHKGKAAKRHKKAKQRSRKASSLPARWTELYKRER